jgi:RNA polymerase sigma-70 factor (ECF subfamily)
MCRTLKTGAMRPETIRASPKRKTPVPFDQLAARHRGELVAYLTRMLGSHADAEDACHDALLRAQRAYPSLPDHTHVRAWLFTIATRTAANLRRGQRRRSAGACTIDPDTVAAAPDQPLDRDLLAAVEALPVRQRAALMLRVFHDHNYRQIGALMGGSAATARANVYQAIKHLKNDLLRHRGERQ